MTLPQKDNLCPNCETGHLIERYDSNGDLYYECDECSYKEA